MKSVRLWSVRNAGWLKTVYQALEGMLALLDPLLKKIGYDRLDKPFAAVESVIKGFLFDSQSCGQCTLGETGMACPMNCPKTLRNGPCGGVRQDGGCEIKPEMTCVWVNAWEGSQRIGAPEETIKIIQPPVDNRLKGHSAWLRALRMRTGRAVVKFDDEPAPGEGLPILPGHTSPGRFERILRAGKFAVTAEIAPPDSADPADVFARAALFDGYVDAINATDSSGANCHMSSMGICSLLTRRGYAMILQQSCRDRNRIAMQGDILGAAAMGVCNILCLSGDGVQSGDHPEAKPVFDMDSISALGMVRHMRDEQQFLSGRAISSPPRLFLGAAANPFAPPFDFRPHRMAKKIAAGAQFIQTQYCFDVERFKTFMAQVRDLGLLEKAYVLAGVGPLASAKSADWIRKNVAGVHIPDAVINRLAGAQDQKQEGVDLCIDLIEQVREIEGVSGVHIMAYRMEDRIGEIVTRSNALDGREPWRPAA